MFSLIEHPYFELNDFNAELCILKLAVGKELGMFWWVKVLVSVAQRVKSCNAPIFKCEGVDH